MVPITGFELQTSMLEATATPIGPQPPIVSFFFSLTYLKNSNFYRIRTESFNLTIGEIRVPDKPVSSSEAKGSIRGNVIRMAGDLDWRIRIVLNRIRGENTILYFGQTFLHYHLNAKAIVNFSRRRK